MASTAKENLDERIERIKKRNEEIEKKYREAEEDRLMALKDNAMVETKPPKDEDWPKAHKYDQIDFTYDVKPEKLEELSKSAKKLEETKKRDYKKFADGEGPPPDPVYNFLADAERDGILPTKNENKSNDRKDSRHANKKNKDQEQRRGGTGNNSFRGRGGKSHSPKYQKQNSHPEYEQWRNEREKIDEARINRQKVGEGKWKREWDNDKLNSENEALLKPERITLSEVFNSGQKRSPTHGNKNHHHSGHPIAPADCLVEKRGNITVSVTQTGEVKSVKLTSAPAIGTGRVGPRPLGKPQFAVQKIEKEANLAPHKSHNNNLHNRPLNTTSPSLNNVKNKRQQISPKSIKSQPLVAAMAPSTVVPVPLIGSKSANDIIAIDLSHKPEFAKKSVQDRLLRVRSLNQEDSFNVKTNNVGGGGVSVEKNENKIDGKNTNCDKTNESIQTTELIAACN